MKINELITSFEIYRSNEEQRVLEKLEVPSSLDQFNEREQIIISNLVKKSLVSKVRHNGNLLVVKNGE